MTFFISYSRHDSEFVEKLSMDLIKNNIKVWKDDWTIQAGEDLNDVITASLKKATFFCIIISSNTQKSDWVMKELQIALDIQKKNGTIEIIPILLDDTKLPQEISNLLYINFQKNYQKGLQEVLSKISSHYNIQKYGRIKEKLEDTFYFFDYGFDEEIDKDSYKLYIDIVSYDSEESFSILTQLIITNSITNYKEEIGISDNDSLIDTLLLTINDAFTQYPARIIVNTKKPSKENFNILNQKKDICFNVRYKVKWLGSSLGSTVVFNLSETFELMCINYGLL